MIKIEETKEKIQEVRRQIELTESDKRKKDLKKHLRKLLKELKCAKDYMNERQMKHG